MGPFSLSGKAFRDVIHELSCPVLHRFIFRSQSNPRWKQRRKEIEASGLELPETILPRPFNNQRAQPKPKPVVKVASKKANVNAAANLRAQLRKQKRRKKRQRASEEKKKQKEKNEKNEKQKTDSSSSAPTEEGSPSAEDDRPAKKQKSDEDESSPPAATATTTETKIALRLDSEGRLEIDPVLTTGISGFLSIAVDKCVW